MKVEIKCSKCTRTFIVQSGDEVAPSHCDDHGLCDGVGLPCRVIKTNVEPANTGKNNNIIYQQPLEGQNNQ